MEASKYLQLLVGTNAKKKKKRNSENTIKNKKRTPMPEVDIMYWFWPGLHSFGQNYL